MRKLLSAGFTRLWKSRIFWLALSCSVLLGLFAVYDQYRMLQRIPTLSVAPEELMFTMMPAMEIVCPILISMFLGTEYSDGTVRNKLICGHKRGDIYFSNLIVCTAASVITQLTLYLVTFLLTLPFSTGSTMMAGQIIYIVACSVLVTVAISAICTLVTMSIQKKASGAVCSIILIILLFFGSSYLDSKLREQELTPMGLVYYEDGHSEWVEPEPNPLYISGAKREVLELVFDALPSGQVSDINNLNFERSERWPILSLGVTVIVSAAGIYIFKKKDIK